jgi:type I restriction enzyme S subunit
MEGFMKYKAYPEYKDSGVEWFCELPKHWNVASLKLLLDIRDGTHDTPPYVDKSDQSYPLVTSKDVTSGNLILDNCKHISMNDYLSIIKRSKVETGDILMPMIGTVGSPIIIKSKGNFAIKNLALFKTSQSKNINTSFLKYFLQSNECNIQFGLESRGGVQNFVPLGTLRDLGFINVPPNEQIQIVNFL